MERAVSDALQTLRQRHAHETAFVECVIADRRHAFFYLKRNVIFFALSPRHVTVVLALVHRSVAAQRYLLQACAIVKRVSRILIIAIVIDSSRCGNRQLLHPAAIHERAFRDARDALRDDNLFHVGAVCERVAIDILNAFGNLHLSAQVRASVEGVFAQKAALGCGHHGCFPQTLAAGECVVSDIHLLPTDFELGGVLLKRIVPDIGSLRHMQRLKCGRVVKAHLTDGAYTVKHHGIHAALIAEPAVISGIETVDPAEICLCGVPVGDGIFDVVFRIKKQIHKIHRRARQGAALVNESVDRVTGREHILNRLNLQF